MVNVHLNWLNLFHFVIVEACVLAIPIDRMIFVIIPRCYKDVNFNSLFSCTTNSLEFSAYRMLSFDL